MKVKIKWDKDGDYKFLGFAVMKGTGEFLVLFSGETGGVMAAPIDSPANVRKGISRNKRFDIV